jgi:hypothetical protein
MRTTARMREAALAGYVCRTAEMSPDFAKVTGLPGTAFADWATGHAAAFR